MTRDPLPISQEFDVLTQLRSPVEADRSDWQLRVFERNPDVKEAHEYFNPVARASSFARLYLPANRMLSHDALLALISQHLRILGLTESQTSLHSEWGAEFRFPAHKRQSQLAVLVQRAVHRTERFWELSQPSVHACETVKATQTALDEEISRTLGAAPSVVQDTSPLRDEKPGDPNFIKTDEGGTEVVEASLNQLIFLLTTHDPARNNFVSELTNALCLHVSAYASSKIFLSKLRDRFALIHEEARKPGAIPGKDSLTISSSSSSSKSGSGTRSTISSRKFSRRHSNLWIPSCCPSTRKFSSKFSTMPPTRRRHAAKRSRVRKAKSSWAHSEQPRIVRNSGRATSLFSTFLLPKLPGS
jgi:hypothetical protein